MKKTIALFLIAMALFGLSIAFMEPVEARAGDPGFCASHPEHKFCQSDGGNRTGGPPIVFP